MRKRPESGERKRILAVSHGVLERVSGESRRTSEMGVLEECRRKAQVWCTKKRGFLVAEEGFVRRALGFTLGLAVLLLEVLF